MVVDATASEDVAARHVQWLARGVHVVTANKLGRGAQLARARPLPKAVPTVARVMATVPPLVPGCRC